MPHGPDHAAHTRITVHLDEGAAPMARYLTHRFPAAESARTTPAFPTSRKRGGRAAVRGGQGWQAPTRRPLRIPGR
ncbi:hypothetical protein ACWEVD_27200 [Nocardia thailandica]|uniref:hypothetical protein n=1 Tax=Nocardia thailandica TaxID=257275 RepID=UPI0002E2AF02|nr:hypothetical protein [Nocardia thailandica]